MSFLSSFSRYDIFSIVGVVGTMVLAIPLTHKAMLHLVENVAPTRNLKWFVFKLAMWTNLVVMVAIASMDVAFIRTSEVSGIVDVELARTSQEMDRMVKSWSQVQLIWVGVGLGFDSLFPITYSCAVASGLIYASSHAGLSGSTRIALERGASLQWVAAICDQIENIAILLSVLDVVKHGTTHPLFPAVSFWFASAKFVLLVIGILVLAVMLVWQRLNSKEQNSKKRN